MNQAQRKRVVVRRVTLERDGDQLSAVAVCPRKLDVVDVAECGACPDFAGLCINPEEGPPFMRCAFEDARFVHSDGGVPPRAGAVVGRACVRDVMARAPHSATLEMTLDQVMRELAHGDALPVIDEHGLALGMITRGDLVQRLLQQERMERRSRGSRSGADEEPVERTLSLRDIALSRSFIVSPDASLGQVAAVMAYERVQHVVVVDENGKLLGCVSALEIARWVAQRAGYVVPAAQIA
jgi:CBS domain-containing protein